MLPIILLSLSGIVNLFFGFNKNRGILVPAALVFLVAALIANYIPGFTLESINKGMLSVDATSKAFSAIMILSGIMIVPLAKKYIDDYRAQPAEYFSILIFSLVGAIMMVSYENLVVLFVGLEILSIAMYVLTGSEKRNAASNEAALKYFLMGSFATGIFLFGIALIYGATGTFTVTGIEDALFAKGAISHENAPLLYIGLSLLLIGMLFKVSAAPFHFWTPDVYQGAPSLFTAFMSTVVKTAGFAAIFRILLSFHLVYSYWFNIVAVLAILSLLVGNITAVYQNSFKRMLAYSSISHAGYMLLAVAAFNFRSQDAILFYSLSYSLASVVAFGVLILVENQRGLQDYDGFNGLAKTNPVLAFVLTASMLSLAGIPLTSGFIGKFYIFAAAAQNGMFTHMVIAVIMSAVGIYYYFRVIIAMYMRPGNEGKPALQVPAGFTAVFAICTFLIILLGLYPALFGWVR